ncbi:MAG: DUF1194 domain-containing protein [Hyphomicrobium sp.]|nr:DUF1194 domain-containing protein [Hyphomicrobium sp.]
MRISTVVFHSVAVIAAFLLSTGILQKTRAVDFEPVDTALVVSVDVSNSVDAERYKLQMEGIAAALEDESVIDAILTGPNGRIVLSMVTWADKPKIAIPWTMIASKDDALAFAARVRKQPREGGEFTCLAGMLRTVSDKVVTQIPAKPLRIVVDVSGDGKDNCNAEEPTEVVRDELVGAGVIINGLPILEGGDADQLEGWYRDHVVGGTGAFVLPADGFGDFGRAIRQKFVVEISGLDPGARYAGTPTR